ncbi:MAG TPA: F0F1 ATP synthase subunit A [Candidatus Dormibacteraeota bacterium]|nr:F0F1 ATP synthase subunit A [Candidatus Dormibacteraeota bacterium]
MNIDVNQPTVTLGCGQWCTFNYNSLISSGLAVVITIAIAFWIRSQLQSGTPSRVQAVFEWGYDLLRGLIRENVSEDALFILPLAMTLFLYILIANWLEYFPLGIFPALHAANADWNQTLAMGLVVFIVVQWYSVRVQGWYGYLRRFTKPFELPLPVRILFIPLNIVEEAVKPITLSLRLFGNIFAGSIMILLIASAGFALDSLGPLPHSTISIILLGVWKGFAVIFIGFIQAFIFMLLTVIYFGMAREGLEHQHH